MRKLSEQDIFRLIDEHRREERKRIWYGRVSVVLALISALFAGIAIGRGSV